MGLIEDFWDFVFGLREVKVDYCSVLVGFIILLGYCFRGGEILRFILYRGWNFVLGVVGIYKIYYIWGLEFCFGIEGSYDKIYFIFRFIFCFRVKKY